MIKLVFIKRKIFHRYCTLLDTFQHKTSYKASFYIDCTHGKTIICTSAKSDSLYLKMGTSMLEINVISGDSQWDRKIDWQMLQQSIVKYSWILWSSWQISLVWNQTQFMVGLFILQKMASSITQLSHGAVLKQLPADHWV